MPSSTYCHYFILDASSSAFTCGSCKSCTTSFSLFCVHLWGESDAGPWKSGSVCSSWGSCFLHIFLFYLQIEIVFFWWLRNGQIFHMRHRSDGRGYICIINSLLLLSVHTTCHRRCQAKVAVTAVVWGFPPNHWNSKQHCHSLTIYPASKRICKHCAVPTSCLGHAVYTHCTDGRLP